MSRKIIGIIRPFIAKQNLYVYEDGNKIDSASPKLEDINKTIFSFIDKYDVQQLDLVGPKQYNRGLAKQFQEEELAKFSENKIHINLI
jgi:hypothetical protein